LALAAARTAIDNRGQDVRVLDTRAQTPLFDYFVIATGSSRRQLHAMSEEIDQKLEVDLHDRRLGIEGYDDSRWIVLDYGSIVIHLFDADARQFYRLEELWADSPRVDF
jgi:ribosome-associated protein